MKMQLHKRKRSKESLSDEYETPDELYNELCQTYGIYPLLDMCAKDKTSKCEGYIDKEMDALAHDYSYSDLAYGGTGWCNPPHSKTKEFVRLCHNIYAIYNCTIMMILPANSMCTKYAQKYIEGIAEYHPIFGRPIFLRNGKKSRFNSRNSYFVVIWRKKTYLNLQEGRAWKPTKKNQYQYNLPHIVHHVRI